MDPDHTATASDAALRHQRVGDLFLAAQERPQGERLAFLLQACGDDTPLLEEVLALLESSQKTGDLLDRPSIRWLIDAAERKPWVMVCPKCGVCVDCESRRSAPPCPADGTELVSGFPGVALVDGKYLVERRLGTGGMGAVYLARHTGLNRAFALKLIDSGLTRSPESRRLFEGEAKALGQLKHRNIVDVTDYGVDPRGLPYLVMELLEGTTLSDAHHRDGELIAGGIAETLPLLHAIADAIDFVHGKGLLHRDVKLSNVFLAEEAKLVDFGLASGDAAGQSLEGGTPHYMAPELFQGGGATRGTDLYAFGVIAYALLTGTLPIDGANVADISDAHKRVAPAAPSKVNPNVPAELDAPIVALLDKDPAKRPASAVGAVEAMEQAWLRARQRIWKSVETPRRQLYALLCAPLAVILAFVLAGRQPLLDLERRTADWRFALHAPEPPDPRILLVSIDEASLSADPTPLATRAAEFGHLLAQVLDAGAAAVAIDFLLPETWSRSPAFAQLVMRNADRLTLALYSTPEGNTVGAEAVAGITASTLGPRVDSLFAFVNVAEDSDGAVRQARLFYADRNGGTRPSWAASAAQKLIPRIATFPDAFWIDASIDDSRFDRLSWKDLPAAINQPQRFRGRLLLVGGEYLSAGDEFRRVPSGERGLTGLALQAAITSTILSGFPVRGAPPWICWVIVDGLCSLLMIAVLCLERWKWIAGAAVAAFGLMIAGVWVVFRWGGWMTPVVGPVAALCVIFAVAAGLRRFLPRFPAI